MQPYQLVKDLENKTENTNPDAVLNGDIDSFIGLRSIKPVMKKILCYFIFILLSSIIFTTIFLTLIGYETNEFNSLLEKKIIEKEPSLNTYSLDKIKINLIQKN